MRSKLKNLQAQLDQEKNRADDLHEQMRMQEIRNIEGQAQLVEGDQRVFEREISKMRSIIAEKGEIQGSFSKSTGHPLILKIRSKNFERGRDDLQAERSH